MAGQDLSGLDWSRLPQDPFYPQNPPQGPSFLDTEACLCALQSSPNANGQDSAWQCIGNQTEGVYVTTNGKWFRPQNAQGRTDLPIHDASNGPDTSEPLMWNSGSESFVAADAKSLSPYDAACTGKNRTSFSTTFYSAVADINANKTPIAAAPCYRLGAIPLQIQTLESWQSQGCNPGFLCSNNTANSLPQYCPPVSQCQSARLAGEECVFQGNNIGMGPFEPVICQEGRYCPKGATEMLVCPAGSYCQPGAASPTPCSAGSVCPEGAIREVFLIPFVLMIFVDALLIGGCIWVGLRHRAQRRRAGKQAPMFPFLAGLGGRSKRGSSMTTVAMTGRYKALPDETTEDHELAPMGGDYAPIHHTSTGFHAALDMDRSRARSLRRRDTTAGTPHLRAFINSMSRATASEELGLSFQYRDLSFQPRSSPRPILQNITGSIERGSLVAVMGGSGAGKSTFVNVLMGKASNTGGHVTVNHTPGRIKRYKKLIGYVPQDDIVLPELTVYENIEHSARVRLPRTWTNEQIETHVTAIVDCLELSHVRDSLVGSVGKPVISGGQRKRVSIGMELAAAPMAIFLDEPTSGLDATSASSIMRTLKALARLGFTVIVIIHQPRMEIFEMLDDLILLANGQIIYEGPENEVQPFFQGIGFNFPEHSNFGDVVTDIITGHGRRYKPTGDTSKEALIAHWAGMRPNLGPDGSLKPNHRDSRAPSPSIQEIETDREAMHRVLKTRGAPRLWQVWLCLRRALLQQYRLKSTLVFELGLASLAGFLIGLAENPKKGVLFVGLYKAPYTDLSKALDFAAAPQLALLVAIAIGLVSGAPGVKVFSEEMLLQRREAEAGHSRIAYFLAKTISSLPRMILGCLHFTTWLFLLAGPTISWGIAFLANLFYFYAIYGLSSCLSMIVRREDAPLFATMLSLIVGILSGAAPPLREVKNWHLEWLWRASPGTWLAELYFGRLVAPYEYLYQIDMAAAGTGYHLDWLWMNMGVLVAIGTGYRVLAFIGLVGGKRLRL